jgi:hypothetical protein
VCDESVLMTTVQEGRASCHVVFQLLHGAVEKKGRLLPSTQQTYAVTCCCQHWGRDVQRSWAPTAYSVDAVAAAVLVLA